MAVDTLFSYIEHLHSPASWETVLDAGTGSHSLEWLLRLPTKSWTAVTGDVAVEAKLKKKFASRMTAADRLVTGNWEDPLFLHGEVYDVVVADYLLGAVDGFSPYFQDRLFVRLRPHVGSRIYVVGLAPYPDATGDPWAKAIVEIVRLRDSCILLAGHRCYREYPMDWVLRHLESAGFTIEEARRFPIRYGPEFVNNQLNVCRRKLPYIQDGGLREGLLQAVERLRERALALCDIHSGSPFGEDYVVYAWR